MNEYRHLGIISFYTGIGICNNVYIIIPLKQLYYNDLDFVVEFNVQILINNPI